jgi:hypothetical protein
MKKLILVPIMALALIGSSIAQTGCAANALQKGNVLNFNRLLPPAPDFAAMKSLPAKEKSAYMKRFQDSIANGTAKMREGKMSITIGDKNKTEGGFITDATLSLENAGLPPFLLANKYECSKDTFYSYPAEQFTQIAEVGVNYTGAVLYPLNLKKGDMLPDHRNILIGYAATGSNKFMLPYIKETIKTNYISGRDGSVLYSTIQNVMGAKEVTQNFSSVTTTETVYANREVVDETTFTYKGKSYKAYTIRFSVLATPKTVITSNYFEDAMNRMVKRAQARAAKKLADDENSMVNYVYEEIFVPEIGVVSSNIMTKDGKPFSKTTLINN